MEYSTETQNKLLIHSVTSKNRQHILLSETCTSAKKPGAKDYILHNVIYRKRKSIGTGSKVVVAVAGSGNGINSK